MNDYTTLAELQEDLSKLLDDYTYRVKQGIEKGVQNAAEIVIRHAEQNSPPDDHAGKEYYKSWAIKPMKHAKYVRYVGNTKKVKGHYTDAKGTIPLINILEFSTKHGHPHVKKIIDSSKNAVYDCIVEKIKEA